MKRRTFLASCATLAGTLALPGRGFAAGPTNLYTDSDSNVLDFWNNVVIPAFGEAQPDAELRMTDAGDSAGLRAIAERAMAAMRTKTDPQADLFEAFDPNLPAGGRDAGLWVDFTKAGLSNYAKLNPAAIQSPFGLPYRGSQVVLAFDTAKLPQNEAPRTWNDLASWIKAHPGQFIYNRPDKGGSGLNFVRRAIYQANGSDPAAFTVDNYSTERAARTLPGAWDILKDLAPSLYEKGAYTSGNTQSIQLLAQGVVTMVPTWSDQVLQAIAQGVLPDTTGIVQLQDLALPGGFSYVTVFANGANRDVALKLADFLLTEKMQSQIISEIGGFPAVAWDNVDPALREKYEAVIPKSIPTFPTGDWEKAINDAWYREVAPGVQRG
ncbi:extracellular solute-binding protein [Aureimonas leprariae]|uniref:Extracellular solute-binding protein n=1 Tax=Plantimonas leprariae TaxID=2615207 RepID=A0A7V7PMM2_9HYPH|nr:extracellular solute-binding protein [Aureimonas leprariae]KAB0678504.1 extracellular solute-binding protein [Aureimonas leprariae]